MASKETENNAKFWGEKQRALLYELNISSSSFPVAFVMVFSGVVNQSPLTAVPEMGSRPINTEDLLHRHLPSLLIK